MYLNFLLLLVDSQQNGGLYSAMLHVLKLTRDCLSHCPAIFLWSLKSEEMAASKTNSRVHTVGILQCTA